TGVRADLEGRRAERAVEDLLAVERSLRSDALDFREALLDFLVQRFAVRRAVRAVGSLHRELADTLQVVGDFRQRAFTGLRERNAVVGIAGSLVEAADLRRKTLRDREAGSVVLSAVDAEGRPPGLQASCTGA